MRVAFYYPLKQSDHSIRGIGKYSESLYEELTKNKDLKIQHFSKQDQINNVDIVHYPMFDFFKNTLPFSKKYPTVVTVHDVTPLLFSKHYPPGIKGKIVLNYQKIKLKKIDAIITDSNCSKSDIIEKLRINENKIFPIYLAPGKEFKEINSRQIIDKTCIKYRLPETFILYVGDINWNKNLSGIAHACKKVGVDLVMVGKNFKPSPNLNHIELKSFKVFMDEFYEDSNFHFPGFIPTEDLVIIMNQAKATILASFYEGFGLPILESQSCGTPVITSKISSMPEVAGDGALFVDPYDVNDISGAIEKILNDKNIAVKLRENGFWNLQKFSWKKTAEETIEVYKYVLNN